MKKFLHLDLFSGIGGFALAAQQVWGKDYETVAFVDNDWFCQQILRKNFPGIPIYGDIKTLTDTSIQRCFAGGSDREKRQVLHNQDGISKEDKSERNGRKCGVAKAITVGLLTGGFPCQPFSQAGRRRGTEDDRFLWPEMLRVIREFKPRWVIGENVAGLLTIEQGVVFDQVCTDLEREGYEVQPFVIPAVSVNAPHRRDRVWIVANCQGFRGGGRTYESRLQKRIVEQDKQKGGKIWSKDKRCSVDDTNPNRNGLQKSGTKQQASRNRQFNENYTNSSSKRLEGEGRSGKRSARVVGNNAGINEQWGESERNRPRQSQEEDRNRDWDTNWVEVATELCKLDDGLPKRMVRLPDGTTISQPRWRKEALKAYGNSIVPQVAIEIMKGIKEIDG